MGLIDLIALYLGALLFFAIDLAAALDMPLETSPSSIEQKTAGSLTINAMEKNRGSPLHTWFPVWLAKLSDGTWLKRLLAWLKSGIPVDEAVVGLEVKAFKEKSKEDKATLDNRTPFDEAAVEPKTGVSKEKSKEHQAKSNVRTVDEPVLEMDNLQEKSKGMAFIDNTGRGLEKFKNDIRDEFSFRKDFSKLALRKKLTKGAEEDPDSHAINFLGSNEFRAMYERWYFTKLQKRDNAIFRLMGGYNSTKTKQVAELLSRA